MSPQHALSFVTPPSHVVKPPVAAATTVSVAIASQIRSAPLPALPLPNNYRCMLRWRHENTLCVVGSGVRLLHGNWHDRWYGAEPVSICQESIASSFPIAADTATASPKRWLRAARSSRSSGSTLPPPMWQLATPTCARSLDLPGAGADRGASPATSSRFVQPACRFLASVPIRLGRAMRSSWTTSSGTPMCLFHAGELDQSCRNASIRAWRGCAGCYWQAESR